MNSVLETTLEEVCEFVGGSQPAKKYFSNTKLPGYIRLIQIRDYKTDNYLTYIPKDSTRKFCEKQDIMIGRYGPPIFQILRGIEGAYNVALMKAVPKQNIINDYLYYFLCQEHLFYYINALSPRTGGQTGVDVVMLKKFPILLPELDYQKQVAKVLSDLDAKIEVNNKINAALEAMAKTLYDYWFVQFDFPDADGKPYKSSGGEMVYNEALNREIPEGWDVKTINECVEKIIDHRGKTPKKLGGDWSSNKDDIIALSAKIVKGGYLRKLEDANRVSQELYDKWMPEKLKDGDVLLTSEAPAGETFFILGKTDYCMSQRLFGLRANSKIILPSLFYYEIAKGNAHFQIQGSLSGSTVFGIRQDVLRTMKVLVPNENIQIQFDDKVLPMLRKIKVLVEQNQKLAELRDWLLPMLMNGQVSVGEVKSDLGMVAEDKGKYN